VDLAAGTGLFTRALFGRAAEVIAVEPDGRMREVLAHRSPRVRVLDGRGEAIPLPDGCADAVFVSTAWHWLNPAQAVPEIARVLRSGGRLGVIWTSRDRAQDWVAELDLLRLPGISGPDVDTDAPPTVDEARAKLDRQHSVTLPAGAEFTNVEAASFWFTRAITVADTITWLATNSAFITASAAEQAAGLDQCRAALLERADGDQVIQMPMRSWCWRADRTSRPLPKASGNN
jgi:SAM-dependent methyltransferase